MTAEMSFGAALQVKLIETLSEFRILEDEWRALEARTPEATGFQTFEWCDAWLRSPQGEHCQLRIVAVYRREQIVFVMPLQIQRYLTLWCARSIGQPATQYQDALALPDAERLSWLDAAIREIQSWKDVDFLHLPQVREDAVILAGLRRFSSSSGNAAPFAPPGSSSTSGTSHLRLPKSLRRRLRHLRASGNLRLEGLSGADQGDSIALIQAWKTDWLRSKGLRLRGLSSRACRDFFPALAQGGALKVHVLLKDGAPIAGELGIVSKGSYRSLLSAFDSSYRKCAPGYALTECLMKKLASEGIAQYDFLAPAEPYKQLWCDGEAHLRTVLMPMSWRGRLAIKIRHQARPLIEVFRRRF